MDSSKLPDSKLAVEFDRLSRALEVGPNRHFCVRAVNELFDVSCRLKGDHFLYASPLAECWASLSQLVPAITISERNEYLLTGPSRKNIVEGGVLSYPNVAILSEPGESNADSLFVLDSYKGLIACFSSLARDEHEFELVKKCAYRAYLAFQLPKPRKGIGSTSLNESADSGEAKLSKKEIKKLLKAASSAKSVYAFFNQILVLSKTNKLSRRLRALLNATMELEVLLVGFALLTKPIELSPTYASRIETNDLDVIPVSRTALQIPEKSSVEGSNGSGTEEPQQLCHTVTIAGSQDISDCLIGAVEPYEVHRSFGKLLRANGMRAYSKVLFNPIERIHLSTYFDEAHKTGNIDLGDLWNILSICTGRPPEHVPEVLCGENSKISQKGEWTVDVTIPDTAADPRDDKPELYEPVLLSLALPLPDIARKYVKWFFSSYLDGSMEGGSHQELANRANELAKASIGRVRMRHGSRFRIERIESQLRYWMALKTKDKALLDIIFGHGSRLVPVQRYYRIFELIGVEEIYRQLSTEYFEIPKQ